MIWMELEDVRLSKVSPNKIDKYVIVRRGVQRNEENRQ